MRVSTDISGVCVLVGEWPRAAVPGWGCVGGGVSFVAPYCEALGRDLMSGRRRTSLAESSVWECDGCRTITVCTRGELHVVEHWTWHSGTKTGGGVWKLLLCASCSAASAPTELHAI